MRISVIIPVFNGARTLPLCLRALAASEFAIDECLVVNDGSTDESASIAAQLGAVVLSTGGRYGPATARNLGARRAGGDLLLFLDADVALHPDAIGRILHRFEGEPKLDALIGAYDDSPADLAFVSQFKNLMHAFVHLDGNPQAFSFWCGCGAVRREIFLEHGGLDESYRRPSIEDIDFGIRMTHSGRRLALDPQVRCKHLKVWTLWSMVRTDVLQRGIPWTELILRTGFFPNDLNLRWSQRASVFMAAVLMPLGAFEVCQIAEGGTAAGAFAGMAGMLLSLATICLLNREFYRYLASRKGWRFSLLAVLLHILYYLYCGLSFALGIGKHACGSILNESFHYTARERNSESASL